MDFIIFLFLFILYVPVIYCFKQAFVHKAVMDELKRIIEDSEVCVVANLQTHLCL